MLTISDLPRSRAWCITVATFVNPLVFLDGMVVIGTAVATTRSSHGIILMDYDVNLIWVNLVGLAATWLLGSLALSRTRVSLNAKGRPSTLLYLYFPLAVATFIAHLMSVVSLVDFNENARTLTDPDTTAHLLQIAQRPAIKWAFNCCGLPNCTSSGQTDCLGAVTSEGRKEGRNFMGIFSVSAWTLLALSLFGFSLLLPVRWYSEHIVKDADHHQQ